MHVDEWLSFFLGGGFVDLFFFFSATDFCLLMPPDPTTQNLVDAEADAVAYCVNPYNNTRRQSSLSPFLTFFIIIELAISDLGLLFSFLLLLLLLKN